MVRVPMSAAASALFRALLARTAISRNRIFLTEFRSTDPQRDDVSLAGENQGLPIAVSEPPRRGADGSFEVELEALTPQPHVREC